MGLVQITREALYEQVWSEPMSHACKEYGISNVGLAKICRKHGIPCPPQGYWAKKSAGQILDQIPLPDSSADKQIITLKVPDLPAASRLSPDLQQRLSDEISRPLAIELRDHLRGAHLLVSSANQQAQAIRRGPDGLGIVPEGFPLELHVSKDLFRRSLFIIDALLRAFEARGDIVGIGPHVILMDVPVYFSISEPLATHREEAQTTDLSGGYEFSFDRYRTTRTPSGKLTLHIRDHAQFRFLSCRQNWRDSPTRSLEDQLHSVVKGLIEFAATIKDEEQKQRQAEESRQQADLRRREEARMRAIKRAAYQAEKTRFDELVEASIRWQKSQALREYIAAAKQAHVDRHGEIGTDSEMGRWLEWAMRQADWLDPLTASPPSLLDEKWEDEQPHEQGYFSRY